MIHVRDTVTLALTKLRTRKIRLTITVIISSLLFSGLVAASLTAQGAFRSVDSFTKEGFGNRYVIQGSSFLSGDVYQNQTIIDRALAIQKDITSAKQAAAKKLNLNYDPTTEHSPVNNFSNPDGNKQQILDPSSPAGQQALAEYMKDHPFATPQDFRNMASTYHPIAYYQSQGFQPGQGNVQVMKGGKESFTNNNQSSMSQGPPTGLDTFVSSWTSMSDELVKPFILKGENLTTGKDGSIPIIIPYSAAEQLLGLDPLPSSAKASTQLARTKQVRASIKDTTFSACYRNAASQQLISDAISTQQQIDAHKTDKEYQKPDLIYGLPTTPCGTSPVIRDVRTTTEKKQAANQQIFDEQFGATPPTQQTVLFRVVGVVQDPNYTNFSQVSQIINNIVGSSLGTGWYMPASQLNHNPLLTTLFTNVPGLSFQNPAQYAEFATPSDEQHFMDKASCTDNPKTCLAKGKQPFMLFPFGSNSIAVSNIRHKFNTFFGLAAIIVALIAAVILMGTVGRMIADSRRETAVFRAIGAKRFDLARVYLLYTVFLSLIICAFALIFGTIISEVLQHKYGPTMTVQALLAYNSQDLNKAFSLVHFYWPDILKILGCIVLAGILSALIPLFRNLRRNPIRDMRDDT